MPIQFMSLASGSRANSAFVRGVGGGLLIDLGLGPQSLMLRLSAGGIELGQIHSAVLTHIHTDHVQDRTLGMMARAGIPLYCHAAHAMALVGRTGFEALAARGLIREFDDRPLLTHGGTRIEAIPVSHDGGPTFGFRIEQGTIRAGTWSAIGYVSDTGSWSCGLADALANVDVLAVEFNHDEFLQRRSGRRRELIERNLGDGGHLSNDQAAELVLETIRRSTRRIPRHLVLLHLSNDCNRPELALATAREAIRRSGRRVEVHATHQEIPTPTLRLQESRRKRRARRIFS
jgi:phosphoribosyl 1,2-cyclic phosphodiesterase